MLDLLCLTEEGYARGYLVGAGRAAADRPPPEAGPCISVLLPTHRPPHGYLARAVRSVLRQSYRNWQLVLADDASPGAETAAWIQALAAQDQRIAWHRAAEHGHISRTTNLALQNARGEYVTFLDQDDELAPCALAQMVHALAARPSAKLLYSDEDRIDPFGTRFLPYFKPAWSPDLLLSQNYICHLALYPRSLLTRLGGLRSGYEGSQDHDLALRASAHLGPDEIVHVPEVLYHWRALEGSTATYGAAAKPYAVDAGRRALADHVAKTAPAAEVHAARGFYAVRWPLPRAAPRVRVVLHGVRDVDADVTLAAWRAQTPAEVGGAQVTWCTVDRAEDAASNAGGAQASTTLTQLLGAATVEQRGGPPEVLVVARADLRPRHAGWLDDVLRQLARPEVGCVGAKVLGRDGRIAELGLVLDATLGPVPSHAGCPADAHGYFGRAALVHNVAAVGRSFLAVRYAAWQRAGGLVAAATPGLADARLGQTLAAHGLRHVVLPELVFTPTFDDASRPERPASHAHAAPGAPTAPGPATCQDLCYSPHLTSLPTSHTYRSLGQVTKASSSPAGSSAQNGVKTRP